MPGYHGGGSGFAEITVVGTHRGGMQPCCPTLPVAMPAQTIGEGDGPPTPSS
ncbi:hypothetical protein OHD29_28085 [Escherichia coli]|uniref:hypothetical protein n=1 Tax=Escherichia coli TaxID=562 RepID=UPI0022380EC5|nr:hypothetical protein [Escherichia coli]MCW7242124.1 hypothetical protein [Escherichia coli]